MVLVDGRFRVACALKCLRLLRDRANWTLVFDDYFSRPAYAVVADFAEPSECLAERIAVFTSLRPNVLRSDLDQAIQRYELSPD